MAGMDLKLTRSDRGMSVFWMILITGAATFLVLAIVLLTDPGAEQGDGAGMPIDEAGIEEPMDGTQIIVGEDDIDATMLSDDVTIPREEIDDTSTEFDNREDEIEVEVGDPLGETALDEAEAEEGRLSGGGDGVTADDLDQSDIVVDPDGTSEPFEPTDSGPEGRDDETILSD